MRHRGPVNASRDGRALKPIEWSFYWCLARQQLKNDWKLTGYSKGSQLPETRTMLQDP
jgi:hypothetical protein